MYDICMMICLDMSANRDHTYIIYFSHGPSLMIDAKMFIIVVKVTVKMNSYQLSHHASPPPEVS